MPGVNRSRDVAATIRRHTHRIEDRERATKKPSRTSAEEIIPIGGSGAMVPARSSPYVARIGGQVVAVVITARCTTTGTSTFRLRIAGTLTGNTITLPAAANPVINGYAGNVRIPAGTVFDLECLTADAALANLGGHIVLKG